MSPSLLLFAAAPLAAQTQTVPPPVVASDPVPTPTPDASPTPAADPSPAVSPTPAATPTPSPAANPESGRAPIAPPSPAPTPDPTPEATPTSEAIAPLPDASPTPETIPDLPGAVTTTVADDARTGDGGGGWLLWAGIAFVVLAAVIVGRLLLPRRRSRVIEEEEEVRAADPPVAPLAASPRPRPAPTAATPAPASAAPTIDFRPARIGLNLVSVTATGDILVRNGADAAMHDIRVRASLLAAAAGHEAAVADLHRRPAGRLAVPSFALDPGETRAIRLTVAAPRSAIEPLSVGGRPMMVPLIAVTVDWRDAVGGRRRTQAFAVGVERVDSAKLAPVWLDQDSRNFDAVAARPHGMVLD